jgi:uncharacterized protein YlxW (UPF0749 family)
MRKQIIIVVLVCSIMAAGLFIVMSIKPVSSEGTSAAQMVSASEQKLQSQISVLSAKISAFNSTISQIQSQTGSTGVIVDTKNLATEVDSLQTQVTSLQNLVDAQDAGKLNAEFDTLQTQVTDLQNKVKAADTKNLTSLVDSLQTQVKELQTRLKGAETSIGITPVAMNGLNIMFITDEIQTGLTGSTAPGTAQFAIKIINTTSAAITNVDVTGTITSSQIFSEAFAVGYPQLTDGAATCSYVFFVKQADCMHFEAFGIAKTSLTIPAASSITLRPKISVLAAQEAFLPPMIFKLALETITYDRVAVK